MAAAILATGCAQMNADELVPELEEQVTADSQRYLDCMSAYAAKYAEATDSATILAEGAGVECGPVLEDIRATLTQIMDSKYMSKSYGKKKVDERIGALEKEARSKVIDTVVKARVGE